MDPWAWIKWNHYQTSRWTLPDDIALWKSIALWESIALHGDSDSELERTKGRARLLKMRYLKYFDKHQSQGCMPPNCRSIVLCPSQKRELGEIGDDEPCHSTEECRQRRARDFTTNFTALEHIVHRLKSPKYSAFCASLISRYICSRCGIGLGSIHRLHCHLTRKTCSDVCQCWLYYEAQRCLIETGVNSTDKSVERRITSIDQLGDHSSPNELEDTDTKKPSLPTHTQLARDAKRKRAVEEEPSSKRCRKLAPRLSSSPYSDTKAILPSNTTSIETGHGSPPKIAATSQTGQNWGTDLLPQTTHAVQPLLVGKLKENPHHKTNGGWTAVNHPNDDDDNNISSPQESNVLAQDKSIIVKGAPSLSNSFEPEKSSEASGPQETLKALSQHSTQSREYSSSISTKIASLDAAKKDFRKLYTDHKASLADDAEHKREEASQKYADNLKAEKEAHAKAIEIKQYELECEKQRTAILDAQLNKTKEKLKVRNALYTQMVSQVEQLLVLPVTAKSEEAQNEQSVLERNRSMFAWGNLSVEKFLKTVKRYGGEVQDTSNALEERLKEVRVTLKRMVDAADAFRSQFVAT